MARKRRRGRYGVLAEEGELNLTPLLDVIFNLIFFFIVATNIRSKESFFDLTLPETSEAAPRQPQDEIPVVNVAADGTIALGNEVMTADELLLRLQQLVRDGAKKAILRADATATVQQATDAMAVIQKAGIREIVQPVRIPR